MDNVLKKSQKLVRLLERRKLYITTVESCTGGGLANAITSVVGASEVFRDGFIAYSDEAKIKLGVNKNILEKYTSYSNETALAMAEAGLKMSVGAEIGVGISGSISRADPKNPDSKPGESFIAVNYKNKKITEKFIFPIQLSRPKAKEKIIERAIEIILENIE